MYCRPDQITNILSILFFLVWCYGAVLLFFCPCSSFTVFRCRPGLTPSASSSFFTSFNLNKKHAVFHSGSCSAKLNDWIPHKVFLFHACFILHTWTLLYIAIYLSLQSNRDEDECLPLTLIYGDIAVDWQTGITQAVINGRRMQASSC